MICLQAISATNWCFSIVHCSCLETHQATKQPVNLSRATDKRVCWGEHLSRKTHALKLVQLLKLLMKVVNLSLICHSMFCMVVNKLRFVFHWWRNSSRPLFCFQIQTTREEHLKKFWSNVREFEIRGVRGSRRYHHGNKQHISWRCTPICDYIRVYTSPLMFSTKIYIF